MTRLSPQKRAELASASGAGVLLAVVLAGLMIWIGIKAFRG